MKFQGCFERKQKILELTKGPDAINDDDFQNADSEEEQTIEDDKFPLMMYGLGIEGYFRFLKSLVCCSCVWSVIAIIVMILYSSGNDGHISGGTGV